MKRHVLTCASFILVFVSIFQTARACSSTDFSNIVYALPAGFHPQTTSGYTSPLSSATKMAGNSTYSSYLSALTTAFSLAGSVAPFFQDHLCGLTAVFVTFDQCSSQADCRENYSWGYRENPDQVGSAGPFNRFVAISQGLLTNTPTLSDYYNAILPPLLGSGRAVASYLAANSGAETTSATVLAILAHEVGHVRWYDVLKPDHVSYNFQRLDNACPDTRPFFEKSWSYNNDTNNLLPPHNWVNFGDIADQQVVDHQAAPFLYDWTAAITPQQAGPVLNHLHSPNWPWPTLLGTLTPTEDFVETYTFSVLMDGLFNGAAPFLQSLSLKINYSNGLSGNVVKRDIPANIYNNGHGSLKGELSRKMTCIVNTSGL
jgi:hypothetical protein